MTLDATDVATALQQLRDTNEVVDTLYRFTAGQTSRTRRCSAPRSRCTPAWTSPNPHIASVSTSR